MNHSRRNAAADRVSAFLIVVVPYQSRLRTVDVLSLDDPDVQDELVGHHRVAPLDLLGSRVAYIPYLTEIRQ